MSEPIKIKLRDVIENGLKALDEGRMQVCRDDAGEGCFYRREWNDGSVTCCVIGSALTSEQADELDAAVTNGFANGTDLETLISDGVVVVDDAESGVLIDLQFIHDNLVTDCDGGVEESIATMRRALDAARAHIVL